MDRLYTPWRRNYVTSLHEPSGCILCQIQGQSDESAGILMRLPTWYVVLNKYPYTTGHLMLVCCRHVGSLDELSAAEQRDYPRALRRAESALRAVYRPQGMNVGLNLGRAAGAGVDGHVHWHVLPRWSGDSNFITVIGDTRVLPETLAESWQRLHPHFQQPLED